MYLVMNNRHCEPYPNTHFLQEVRTAILRQLDVESFGVRELAVALSMSRSQLFRRIKELSGRHVSAFIQQVRVEEACVLLRTSPMTVEQIAFQTGFFDASHFRRIFRREMGVPPKAYREAQVLERVGTWLY